MVSLDLLDQEAHPSGNQLIFRLERPSIAMPRLNVQGLRPTQTMSEVDHHEGWLDAPRCQWGLPEEDVRWFEEVAQRPVEAW